MIVLIEPFKDRVEVSYPETIYSNSITNQHICNELISSMLRTSELLNGDAVFHIDAGFNTEEVISFVESCNVPNTFAIKYQSGGGDKVLACSKMNSPFLMQYELDQQQSKTDRINALGYALEHLHGARTIVYRGESSGKKDPTNKAIDDIATELSKLISQQD